MSDFMNTYFGPLDKSACVYFFILTVFFFLGLVFVLFYELYFIITNFKNLNFRVFTNTILVFFNLFVAYFINRLFYSMCTKSLA